MDGVLLIDKPAGMTSHDVVQQARRLLHEKKIGHCGTLDPEATGLLVLTVGRSTRLTRFLIRAPKVYAGTIRLGVATDTYDAAGEQTARHSTEAVTDDAVQRCMHELTGTLDQNVPPFSAKKIDGVKRYQLARRGEAVPRVTKTVTIYEFTPTASLHEDRVEFRLSCTSGTYARTLAHDLGEKLGCGGHLEGLRRLQVGPFQLDQATTLEALSDLPQGTPPSRGWVRFDDIPLPFGELKTDAAQERKISHGQAILVRDLQAEEGDWIKLVGPRHDFLAVGTVAERIGDGRIGVVQPRIVFKQ
jgi:tRNA pseudouridine55 synthase